MTKRVTTQLTERLGVCDSWASMGRVAAWAVAWALVLSLVAVPFLPDPLERELPADQPESTVRYLGPVSRQDFAGFAPSDDPDGVFTVAWIGGSEVKLQGVSVIGEVSNRVQSFGGQPVQFDGYTLIAPRPIEALRALDAAVSNGADAVVITLNTAWVSDEWSMRDWPNLDVANVGTLWDDPSLWPWAATLTSPADLAWRTTRAASPIVEAQFPLSSDAAEQRDRLSIVEQPEDLASRPAPEPDLRIPADEVDFWLTQDRGVGAFPDLPTRVAAMVEGLDDDQPTAEFFAQQLLERAEAAGIPVYLYPTPINPVDLDSDVFGQASIAIESFWERQAMSVRSDLIDFESRLISRDLPLDAPFGDLVHMLDAGPMADLLVGPLCRNWQRADPGGECT